MAHIPVPVPMSSTFYSSRKFDASDYTVPCHSLPEGSPRWVLGTASHPGAECSCGGFGAGRCQRAVQ
jgi:hypothetical protein